MRYVQFLVTSRNNCAFLKRRKPSKISHRKPNSENQTCPTITFPFDIRKFVKENDLIMLVEGSCYMDTWGSALLWYYLLATRYAHSMKKPCVAYSVDAGTASRFNRWLIRREASKTNLIFARTQEAADRLKKWGVKAPIEVTADNAFAFRSKTSAMKDLLKRGLARSFSRCWRGC